MEEKNKQMELFPYTFDDYQKDCLKTAIYPEVCKVMYPSLGLAGESGEVCDKIKKVYRDDEGIISDEKRKEIAKEIGDVLWYCAALCSDLGISLQSVALMNKDKLFSRLERGVLHGNGDNR